MRFGCVLPILLILSSLASAQEDLAPRPRDAPLVLHLAPNSNGSTLYLAPNSQGLTIHVPPAAPPLNINQFLRETPDNDPTLTPTNILQPRLSVDMSIATPFRGDAADGEMIKAMAQSMQSLNEAISRQCEIFIASFKGGCQASRISVDGALTRSPGGGQSVDANVRATFELPPSPGSPAATPNR
jgi:hypothetical protein